MATLSAIGVQSTSYAPYIAGPTDIISSPILALTELGDATVFGDNFTQTLNLGGGTNNNVVNIGRATTTTNFPGDVVIDGNITLNGAAANIEATNVEINDQLIIMNAGNATEANGGFAIERGADGDDAVFYYNAAAGEWQLGFADTADGATVPSTLTSALAKLRALEFTAPTVSAADASSALTLVSHNQSIPVTAGATALTTAASSLVEAINELDAAVDAATPTLQNAYNGGQTITHSTATGNLFISGDAEVTLSADDRLTLEAAGNKIDFFDGGSRDLTLSTTLNHNIDLLSDGSVNVTGDNVSIVTSGGFSLITGAFSNAISANKPLSITTSDSALIEVTASGNSFFRTVGSSALDLTTTVSASNGGAGDALVSIAASQDINFDANDSGAIPFNETGQLGLRSDITATGVSSVIGAINKAFQNTGWVSINDTTYTDVSPQAFLADTPKQLLINADSTITTYLPKNTVLADWFDSSLIQGHQLGDIIAVRLSFLCTFGTTQNEVEIELDIGGSQGVIWGRSVRLNRGSGQVNRVTETMELFTLGTFLANGGQINMMFDVNTDVYDINLLIIRNSEAF